MAMLAQKHKTSASYGVRGHFLLFRGQHDGRVPHNGLLKVEGARCFFTYQTTDMPLLSTLYEPLSKQLISVLGWPPTAVPSERVSIRQCL